ncbi:hypothetical protein [Pseudomonas shahriarae]|uniref:Uncharacterized protein n=1 Tax=Pseudomonas shahriarae TaxID=2745512 RepID=A0ABT5NB61_9PSED|nr:hypothetical protein [Pseudomonas shahriarae]MDD0985771.1 hypothetical protein [Pseudomonas shahriarae]MDD1032709.1 hypothetical protein [Pseudomonas shahriarae]
MASKKLEAFREWFTPRKRLWTGVGLLAIAIALPIASPGTTAAWLIGPATVFFLGSFIPDTNKKR